MKPRDVVVILGIAACASPPAPIASAPPVVAPTGSGPDAPPNGVAVTLADVGLEASSLDRSADPCVDFYQFACGGWIQSNPIPADRGAWSRFAEVDQKNKLAIENLLEVAAKGDDGSAKQLGDFYASCMDEQNIEKAGLVAAKPLLDRTRKITDARSWLAALVELHKLGIWAVWSNEAYPDLKDSTTNVTYLDADGLGLPDRDYYLKPDFRDKAAGYKLHVGRLLALAGLPRAEAAAADVLAIETELAKLTKTAVEWRDAAAGYHPTDAKGLAQQVRTVDWAAYWKGLGAEPSKMIVVGTPAFFAGLDKLRAQFKPAQWSAYLTYHLVAALGPSLGKAIDQEVFELRKLLSGVEKQRDRNWRCIEATQRSLGELIGQTYVARHFTGAARQVATTMIDTMVQLLHQEIGELDWMSATTRGLAQDKLGKLVRMVGFPDKWRTYDFEVKRDDFAGNTIRSRAFETRRNLLRAGTAVDRSEWRMQTYQVDAYYSFSTNTTVLPAGILQPPYFGQDRAVAANLGAIGMFIGHELTHGFDDQGARFDGDGNLKDWWAKGDAARFAERTACVADQYSTFEAMPKTYVDGKLTLGENIADLGGVRLAWKAYRRLRKDAAKTLVAEGFSEDQQFFIANAQMWCSRERPAALQRQLATDGHAPWRFRVYGSLRNMKEFAEAFRCAPGTPMHPTRTCSVW